MSVIFEQVSVSFDKQSVLNGLNMQLQAGQIACLLGSSGCGKTTALRALMGFCTPQQGRIVLDDQVLFDATNRINIAAHRRKVGMVFQDYALFPHLSVADNITFGIRELDKATQKARLSEMLSLVGLSDFAKRYPHELSGGQQQRVALARALAPKPSLILLDEPFSNLDVALRSSLSLDVRQLLKSQGVSAILVTHDQMEAFAMADVVGVMAQGVIKQWATPTTLYQYPKDEAIARFIGDGVLLDVSAWQDGVADTALGKLAYEDGLPEYLPNSTQTVKMLLRPEQVQLVHTNQDDNTTIPPNAIKATVDSYLFKGGYWLCALQAKNTTLLAYQDQKYKPNVGDTVYLNLDKGWLVAA